MTKRNMPDPRPLPPLPEKAGAHEMQEILLDLRRAAEYWNTDHTSSAETSLLLSVTNALDRLLTHLAARHAGGGNDG